MQDYVIGLGANLGPRLQTLRSARAALDALPGCEVVATSPIYESAPVGPPQPDYLNAALRLRTDWAPLQLLEAMLQIERDHGRERRTRWGPRTLDLDILHGPERLDTPALRIPHPELTARWFALRPLLDVAPELRRTYAAALAQLAIEVSPIKDAF